MLNDPAERSLRPTVRIERIEHRSAADALGIDNPRPRLSWTTETAAPAWRQAAYELELDGAPCGRVESGDSVLVPWPGEPLTSRRRVAVRVRVWGEHDDEPSDWSEPAHVEAGLLDPADWTARFVTPAACGGRGEPLPLLRRDFALRGPIARARLYVTALGLYEIELNGERVGDQVLDPGWTTFEKRLRYDAHDVTALLTPGENALCALLGDGWYRGRIGYSGKRDIGRHRLALLAQLEVEYADGTQATFATDEAWQAAPGPILASDLYDGESHDARREPGPGDWGPVELLERDLSVLVARPGPPVRRTEERAPVAIGRAPSGATIADFGQNLVGRVRLTVRGEAGTTITLRHAEALEDGELHTAPLQTARQTDTYVLAGAGEPETWEPRFTSHGFRYAELTGWPGEGPSPDDLRAIVCHSDMQRTGWFECSDERVERLHENIVWSLRGNFVDVHTDCPQRDERLGWTGDLTPFVPTACSLYDVAGVLRGWLANLALDQGADGSVPFAVPNPGGGTPGVPYAGWSDAAVVVPWTLHERFGDVEILRAQYASMTAYVELVESRVGEDGLWKGDYQFGDWLDPTAPIEDGSAGPTDKDLLANAWRCRSLELVARSAELLGEAADAERYAGRAGAARAAFAREYLAPNGRLTSDTQGAYAIALGFGLLPGEGARERAGARLSQLVAANDGCLATGFVTTPYLCDALAGAGRADLAYAVLLQERQPSWLFEVLHGATTMWENWRLLDPDGELHEDLGEQNLGSQNHFALGSVADWLHRSVAGLAPAEPGYRRLLVRPVPGPGLTWARTRHRTPYGLAAAGWRIDGEQVEVTATVPPNVTATVHLPGAEADPIEVGSGTHRWRRPYAPPPTRPEDVRA